MTRESDIDIARNVIRIEREALEQLEAGLDTAIEKAADLIMATDRHIIVAGVGKSGHIGQKIAASLASTGTPSFFLHPTEASHGDLGMIVPGSVVIAISYSGESRELVDLIRYCRTNSVPLIGMSRAAESTLGRGSDVLLTLPTVAEACPNGLAPTSSTTMALALGDALTIVLMARRGFSREEFGFRHPGETWPLPPDCRRLCGGSHRRYTIGQRNRGCRRRHSGHLGRPQGMRGRTGCDWRDCGNGHRRRLATCHAGRKADRKCRRDHDAIAPHDFTRRAYVRSHQEIDRASHLQRIRCARWTPGRDCRHERPSRRRLCLIGLLGQFEPDIYLGRIANFTA